MPLAFPADATVKPLHSEEEHPFFRRALRRMHQQSEAESTGQGEKPSRWKTTPMRAGKLVGAAICAVSIAIYWNYITGKISAPPTSRLAATQPPVSGSGKADESRLAEHREKMVKDQIEGRDVSDPAVLKAMRKVPRHLFVPPGQVSEAYEDYPLPIGSGQTISQPYIVGLMTQSMALRGGERVLEIGTGSGYQAAVLAELVAEVFTIEIVPELGRSAGDRLKRLGYKNVHVKIGDGYQGWPEHAPFDAVMVTAAADDIPVPLVEQLKPGGRLVIPVGPPALSQDLIVGTKSADGTLTKRSVRPVRFVPLIHTH